MTGKLFIISAPSGAGKTTLINAVVDRLNKQFSLQRLITYTSRKKRPGEIDGADYHFLTSDEFKQRIARDYFLEYSCEYHNYYGSPSYIIQQLQKGISIIGILDQFGAQQIEKKIDNVVSVWLYTSNLTILKQRLEKRNTDPKEIQKRLEIAKNELHREKEKPFYKYHICNDNFDHALQKLEHIIVSFLRSK